MLPENAQDRVVSPFPQRCIHRSAIIPPAVSYYIMSKGAVCFDCRRKLEAAAARVSQSIVESRAESQEADWPAELEAFDV